MKQRATRPGELGTPKGLERVACVLGMILFAGFKIVEMVWTAIQSVLV